jgi:GTP-binding protein
MLIKQAEFIKSSVDSNSLPPEDRLEFMFCGRSNVGKSSFINMLCNNYKLARTSSNPGKTQTLNFFLINKEFYFVDVPGYGYARVSKSIKETFGKMIEEYVTTRKALKMVFLLVDFRHKPTEDDCLMYEFLKYHKLPVTIIATKSDKIKNSERKKCKEAIINTLKLSSEDKFIITSSEKKEGLGLVLTLLDEVCEKYPEYPIMDDIEEV